MSKKYIFSFLMLMISVAALQADPYAFPVPFIRKQHTKVFFKDLPADGTIRIFTVNGETVREIPFEHYPATTPEWDIKNGDGKSVSTGVYFFEVDSATAKTLGKLVVIQ